MPSSSRRGSRAGAPGSYTDRGPPDRTMALASWALTVAGSTSQATTSEKTWHSRMRRAMSWAYWAPKSSTRTVSWPGAGVVMGGRITNSRSGLLARLGQSTLNVKGAWSPLGAQTSHRTSNAGCVVLFLFPAKENDGDRAGGQHHRRARGRDGRPGRRPHPAARARRRPGGALVRGGAHLRRRRLRDPAVALQPRQLLLGPPGLGPPGDHPSPPGRRGGIGPAPRDQPIPTPWERWRSLPSVCSDGATMTSAFWNSLTVW